LAVWLFTIAAAFAGGAVLTGAWRRERCGQAEAAAEAHRGHAAELGVELAHMRRQRDEARVRCDAQEARAWEAESAAQQWIWRAAELARQERDAHDRLLPVLGGQDIALDLSDLDTADSVMTGSEWLRLLGGDPDVPVLPTVLPSRRELEPAP
jgi:hypothetical protein